MTLGLAGGELTISLGLFFAIGLLGGAHCLGMCGPLVTLYSRHFGTETDAVEWIEIRQHLLFNFGRTVSYAVIGALMGAIGLVVVDVATIATIANGVRALVGIGVGTFIVATGVGYAAKGSIPVDPSVPVVGSLFAQATGAITAHLDTWTSGPRIVALGGIHGLLPCPILYPAFLYAFAVGSPTFGALSLGVLGLGTVPTLFVFGTAFQSLSGGTRLRVHRVLGVVFIALGYVALAMGLMAIGIRLPMPPIPYYQPLG